jgi:hypothetical protein
MSTLTANLSKWFKLRNWSRFLLPRQEDMLFLAIFVAVIGLGPRLLNMDGDLGRHLTIGDYILDELTIPTRDIFSHTMGGFQLTPHEWLAQVVFALSYRIGGLDGVVILCALVIAGTFALVFRQSLSRSRLLVVSLGLTILGAAAASVHWLARPHIFTLLFTVLWVGELEKWRQEETWHWWSIPLLMLVWVNFHGAFIVGVLIWLIYLVDHLISGNIFTEGETGSVNNGELNTNFGTRTRQLLLVGGLALFVTVLNPAGWRVWNTTFGFLQNQYLVRHTVEYQPPDFQMLSFWPFLLMICLSLLVISLKRTRISIASALLIVSWTAFSLVSARNIAIYAVVVTPLLAGVAASILRENEVFNRMVAFDDRLSLVDNKLIGYFWPLVSSIIIGLLLISGATFNYWGTSNQFSESVFPVRAVNWLSEQPAIEPIFNYFPWGGYLLYRSWPEQRVFIDGQTDFYGESLTRQYEKVITLASGWQAVLEEYDVSRVIMPSDSVLVKGLMALDGWELVYQDETAAILDSRP